MKRFLLVILISTVLFAMPVSAAKEPIELLASTSYSFTKTVLVSKSVGGEMQTWRFIYAGTIHYNPNTGQVASVSVSFRNMDTSSVNTNIVTYRQSERITYTKGIGYVDFYPSFEMYIGLSGVVGSAAPNQKIHFGRITNPFRIYLP